MFHIIAISILLALPVWAYYQIEAESEDVKASRAFYGKGPL